MKRIQKLFCGIGTVVLVIALLFPVCLAAQSQKGLAEITVSGSVTDNSGESLPGASVKAKGKKNVGVATNIDGQYTIKVMPNATLVVSYVGCAPQEVKVDGRTHIDVVLKVEENVLNEVVAIGYGTVKKRDLTGSVGSLSSKDLMSTSPASLNAGMQGKIAGVVVNQSDGAPGAGINIQVRGANSFATSSEPLYIVDGIPFNTGSAPTTGQTNDNQTNNPLASINPADIESIEVLKDASSTAIYGSRGANGVVIITTKGGKEGKAKVDFSANFGLSSVAKKIDVLSAADFARFRNERIEYSTIYGGRPESQIPYPEQGYWSETTREDPATGQLVVIDREYNPGISDFENGYYRHEGDSEKFYGTNWQDEIFQTAFNQDYNLSVSGGNDRGNYLFSAGWLDQQGVIKNSYFKRFTARSNNMRKINKFMEIGMYMTFSKSENRLARTNSESFAVIPSAISFSPLRPVFDPSADSGYSEDFSTGLANPYLMVKTEKNILSSAAFYGSGYLQINFTDWLFFRQNIGYGYNYDERNQYYNRFTGAGQSPTNGYAVKSSGVYSSITEESLLNFNKSFGVNSINAVFGITYENVNWHSTYMNAKGFASDTCEDNSIGDATGDKTISSNRGKSQLMSYLFRVNYSLRDKYLFTFSWRRDGSSRLSTNRWNNFYSGAFAWRLSNEKFISDLHFFDNLKIRLSAGQTGNQGINAYATRSRFVAANYPYNGILTGGLSEDRWGGPAAANLKWETTNQFDAGIDVSIFHSRVNFTFDAYFKRTKDLLQYRMIPMSSGFKELASNFGNVDNKGIELSGHFIPVTTHDFTWSIDANISWNRNRVHGLEADSYNDIVWGMSSMSLLRNGCAIGTLYGYVEDSLYDNEAEVRADPNYTNASAATVKAMVGEIKYKNLDDDPVIDDRDRTIIGNTNPDFTYGLTMNFNWKRWGASFFFQGSHGNDILNVNLRSFDMSSTNNMPYFVWKNRWTPENRFNATWPRADATYTRSMKPSDRYVEDGSYLRLKNISINYNWPKPCPYIENVNFIASVSNVFTITNYRWYDPDVNSFGSDAKRRGIDMSSYPSARNFNFTVQLSF